MLQRAYAVLTVKAFDDDQRVIEGIATTPSPDRMGDVVEPLGVKFKNPLPLLHQHQSDQPVGTVRFGKPTADGISFTATLPKITEPGILKDRIDTAWGEVKAGLVRAVSIGFREMEDGWERMKNGGIRFTNIEVLELSLVTIPANAQATIQTIKSIDSGLRAALGHSQDAVDTLPGASGLPVVKLINPKPKRDSMENIADQIKSFESTLAAKLSQRDEIQQKASGEGRTKDDSERESFDTLSGEIKSLNQELADLRTMEKDAITSTARPVIATGIAPASVSRETAPTNVIVKAEEKLEKGIEFARFAMCVAASKGNPDVALRLAEEHYPQQQRAISVLKAASRSGRSYDNLISSMKAAVSAGTTTDSTWAAPLLAHNNFAGDFVDYLRPRTIVGQFGQNGIPDLRRIPFNVWIKGQTSGGSGSWVGEGKPKPVTKYDFVDTHHGFTKVAGMAVLTEELIRFSDPSAERIVRDSLADTLIARIDSDFVDPLIDATSGVRPASITYGVNPYTSSGDDGDAVRTDLASLWQAGITANLPLSDAVYIMSPVIALQLSLMLNPLGQREFPEVTMTGGRLNGVPVLVSNYAPAGVVILVYASEIYLSDDGTVTVDASREASIQMMDNTAGGVGAPTNNPVTPTATSLVSMFQTDSVALRAHRYINWSKRRASAVAMVEDVSWGGALLS